MYREKRSFMGPEVKHPPLSPKVEEKGILDSEAIFRALKQTLCHTYQLVTSLGQFGSARP